MNSTVQLAMVLSVVAVACALPGAFLVLRRAAMTSDAIGHVLLFGIVLAYFALRASDVKDPLDSPWLMFGAAAAGLLAVVLVESLEKSGRVKADAALGLVFAALFAAGVLMVSVSVKNVHLDVDQDRKSTRLNSSHGYISYAVFCLKKKKTKENKPN